MDAVIVHAGAGRTREAGAGLQLPPRRALGGLHAVLEADIERIAVILVIDVTCPRSNSTPAAVAAFVASLAYAANDVAEFVERFMSLVACAACATERSWS